MAFLEWRFEFMLIRKLSLGWFVLFGGFLSFAPSGWGEVIGKSMVTVNGEAIYLADFENNWDSVMEQEQRANPKLEINEDWKKKNKKLLLDQMIEEKLLLQEAKRRKVVVPKRQLEEGMLQVKNRFKIIDPGTKPTREDYERELTDRERKEFQKELEKQNISEKE